MEHYIFIEKKKYQINLVFLDYRSDPDLTKSNGFKTLDIGILIEQRW